MGDTVAVEIRILGPVTATVDGRAVRLGPQQRVLLAVLALEPGRMLPSARLVELLWGDPAPAAAAGTLRSHILHLRRALEPGRSAATAEVVVTEPGGYRLRVAPERIDAVRFDLAVTAGRQALVAGRPADAAERLRDALELWRGPALAGVADRPFTVAATARLEGLRQAALRSRIEAELALGGHREVIGELTGMLAEAPLDEDVRRLLVLALYRADRHEEAARTCQAGLALLHRRGLDTTRLRELQEKILRTAPELGRPASVTRPFQLPPDAAEFTGRDTELALLSDRLRHSTGTAILAVDGPPGIGKSSLVNHLAHRLSGEFPDGVLYVNLRGAEPQRLAPLTVLARFLRTLGVADPHRSADLGTATAMYRSMLADRRMLVVLDNAADASQARPLLPSGPRCATLITSRAPLSELDGVVSIRLGLLDTDAAVRLLTHFAGPERVAADRDAAGQVAERCGRLPLALRIAGARLRARPGWSMPDLAARLADTGQRLAELSIGDLAVRASFQLSYRALPADQQRAFRLLGLLDVPEITPEVAAAVASADVPEATALLERLADAQLLESPGPDRYRFHDLMRLFAREQAEATESEQARSSALARVLTRYLACATHCHAVLAPATRPRPSPPPCHPPPVPMATRAAALDWLDAERANLIAATAQAASHRHESVASLAWKLSDVLVAFFPLRTSYAECTALCEAAARAGERFGSAAVRARTLSHLGEVHRLQHRFDAAIDCLNQSLELSRQTGARRRESLTLNNLGRAYLDLGRYRPAIDHLGRGLAISRELGDQEAEAFTLRSLGLVHRADGEHRLASRYLRRSVILFRLVGDRQGEAENLALLGDVLLDQHRCGQAVTRFEQSLALCREIGDRHDEAMALWGLGRATAATGAARAARGHWAAALDIFTGLGAPEATELHALLAAEIPAADVFSPAALASYPRVDAGLDG